MYKFSIIIITAICCLFISPLPTESVAASVDVRSVQVGVEGFYKNGLWTPVVVELSGTENVSVSLTTSDSDGTPVTYQRNTIGNKVLIYAKLGRKGGPMTVHIKKQWLTIQKQFQPSGNPFRQQKLVPQPQESRFFEPVPSERPIYLIIGNEDIGLQGAIAELSFREERRPILVKVNSIAELPDQWFGYEAVEMIVLTTTEPKLFEGLTADSPQIKAIDDWVRLGGRLFFCAGKDSGRFLEKDGVLCPFLPGKFERMTELRDGKPLSAFITSKQPFLMNGTAEAPFLKMPYFTEPQGITIVKDLDNPLLLRCAHGFGSIIYFGGDLSGKPLSAWRDRVQLVRYIMQWTTERGGGIPPRSGAMIQLGYNDISGQVRSALDNFDGVRIMPFSIILIILAVYWLVVGPLDWFVVHKVLKRPVLTWITFPLWIILFSALAYLLASGGRPSKAMLNELDLVDLDSKTGAVRCSTWGNLYSPNDERYTLNLNDGNKISPMCTKMFRLFSWNGLSGSGLGGMAPKTVSPTVWQTGSLHNDWHGQFFYSKIEDVPVPVRSTKSFFGQCWSNHDYDDFCISSHLTDEEGVPVGHLESRITAYQTPKDTTLCFEVPPLDNCILVYGRWVQDIGTLEPGQKIDVGKKTPRRELRDLLLSKEILEDAVLQRMSSYNPQSVDLDYIVRVLSLHNILGGYETTGLFNTFQKSLDMSDLLSVDRAILIGTVRDSKNAGFGSIITSGKTDRPNRLKPFDGKRLIVVRQLLPIAPDLLQRLELKYDKLDDKPKDIKGPDDYNPGL